MSRSSYSLQISTQIPPPITPSDTVSALHNHSNVLSLQALTAEHKELPVTPSAAAKVSREDCFFLSSIFHGGNKNNNDDDSTCVSLKHYQATEAIPIIPGIGDWGKIYITFPVWFQDTHSGIRTRADAPGGVVVRAEWAVQEQEMAASSPFNMDATSDEPRWALIENVTVECHWVLLPFVRKQTGLAHQDICVKFVEMLKKG